MKSMVFDAGTGPRCSPCYFTIVATGFDHFSVETPTPASPTTSAFFDTPSLPSHPSYAHRDSHKPSSPLSSPNMPSGNVLQLQATASHGPSAPRPRPKPVQNVLHVTSDDSTSSSDSSSTDSIRSGSSSSLDTARCSRCQRTPSIDIRSGQCNMVQYGLNLWYCLRCAGVVGLHR